MKIKLSFIAGLMVLLAGCAGPEVAVNQHADFTRIRRVAVASFSGAGGDAAADMLTQDLLARGADVVERQRLDEVLREQQLGTTGALSPDTIKKVGKILGIDAIFMGTVANNVPKQSYLITSGGEGSINLNQVTPVSGQTVYSQGQAIGINGSEIITSAANVALIARMVDTENGSVLWSARMTYEGLDTLTAMGDITSSFANSLIPLWPEIHSTK